jgi:hypothetical protein
MNSTRYVPPSRRAAAMVIAAIAFSAMVGAAIVTWLSAEQTPLMSRCDLNSSPNQHATCTREDVTREERWRSTGRVFPEEHLIATFCTTVGGHSGTSADGPRA